MWRRLGVDTRNDGARLRSRDARACAGRFARAHMRRKPSGLLRGPFSRRLADETSASSFEKQAFAREAEQLRRLGHATARCLERAVDELFFQVVDRVGQRLIEFHEETGGLCRDLDQRRSGRPVSSDVRSQIPCAQARRRRRQERRRGGFRSRVRGCFLASRGAGGRRRSHPRVSTQTGCIRAPSATGTGLRGPGFRPFVRAGAGARVS